MKAYGGGELCRKQRCRVPKFSKKDTPDFSQMTFESLHLPKNATSFCKATA